MDLLTFLLVIVLVGVGLYVVNRKVPMQSTVKGILNAVVIICLVIWILSAFGLLDKISTVSVPRVG